MVPSAFLRVYQPLDAFERSEQLHWERFLLHGPEVSQPRLRRYADHPTVGRLGVLAPADVDSAEVLHVEGRTLISPRRMRMRVLAAMVSFRETRPIELWDQFVPRKDGKRAAKDLARLRRRDPSAVAFCHQSPWYVPIRWFVLFRDEERELIDADGRWRLRYRTTTRRAIRRAEQAIGPLRRSDLGPIGDLILDLHQWMVQFDPASIVELDYGGLCDFQRWDELDDDHSARDIHEALRSLEASEFVRAADVYQGLLSRWAEVRGREILN